MTSNYLKLNSTSKNVISWLHALKEPQKSEAIENLHYMCGLRNDCNPCIDISDAINIFNWSNTRQGVNYWQNISNDSGSYINKDVVTSVILDMKDIEYSVISDILVKILNIDRDKEHSHALAISLSPALHSNDLINVYKTLNPRIRENSHHIHTFNNFNAELNKHKIRTIRHKGRTIIYQIRPNKTK